MIQHDKPGPDGQVLARVLMRPQVAHHEDGLDVCLLRLEDETGALQRMKQHGLALETLELSDVVPTAGQVRYLRGMRINPSPCP